MPDQTTDLITRLRHTAENSDTASRLDMAIAMTEAADEIERLREIIADARYALDRVIEEGELAARRLDERLRPEED